MITNLSLPSGYKLIEVMKKLNAIKEITCEKRRKLYLLEDYLKLFN